MLVPSVSTVDDGDDGNSIILDPMRPTGDIACPVGSWLAVLSIYTLRLANWTGRSIKTVKPNQNALLRPCPRGSVRRRGIHSSPTPSTRGMVEPENVGTTLAISLSPSAWFLDIVRARCRYASLCMTTRS